MFCRWCHHPIMKVGLLWYRKDIADINAYCSQSLDDRHEPGNRDHYD
jgi:hypothetical protein